MAEGRRNGLRAAVMIPLALPLVSCLLLPACSEVFSDADLAGDYTATYRGDNATLAVRPDHTYSHAVTTRDGRTLYQEASWNATQLKMPHDRLKPVRTIVEFSGFRAVPAFFDGQHAGWVTEPDRTWLGRLRLCFDDDLGYCYVKAADP